MQVYNHHQIHETLLHSLQTNVLIVFVPEHVVYSSKTTSFMKPLNLGEY